MNKLIYQCDDFSIELDITDELRCAVVTGDRKFIERPFCEMKKLITQNTKGLRPEFTPPKPLYTTIV